MRINWDLAGQIVTVWFMAAFIAAPFIGSYLRKRRVRAEFKALIENAQKERTVMLRAKLGVAEAQLERQKFASEAAIPLTENQWLQRAREAEALFPDERAS